MLTHPGHLLAGAAVHPDQARVQRRHLRIHGNARTAVQTADAQRLDLRRRHTGLGHALGHAGLDGIQPHLRPLLGPAHFRGVHSVAVAVLGDDCALGIHQQRLGALGANVYTDDVVHLRAPASTAP